jgi:hypothetical protein
MALKLKLESIEDFQQMMESKDIRITESIVGGILKNLNTKKKEIKVLSINFKDDDSIFEISVDKEYFIETLEENLPIFAKEERYEDCQIIKNAIDKLKNKK